MAKFSVNGFDSIQASFQQISQLTDEEKYSVIESAAELLKDKFRTKLMSLFTQRTGSLANSLEIVKKSGSEGSYAHITPKGKHPGSTTGKRKKKGRSSGHYSGTNAEVAAILEYGSPRIEATHWMENTLEESEEEILAAEQAAWDALLTSKGL